MPHALRLGVECADFAYPRARSILTPPMPSTASCLMRACAVATIEIRRDHAVIRSIFRRSVSRKNNRRCVHFLPSLKPTRRFSPRPSSSNRNFIRQKLHMIPAVSNPSACTTAIHPRECPDACKSCCQHIVTHAAGIFRSRAENMRSAASMPSPPAEHVGISAFRPISIVKYATVRFLHVFEKFFDYIIP